MQFRVIQVGVGGFGRCWTPVILKSKETRLAGFVDKNPAVLKEEASRYNLQESIPFTSIEEAIDREGCQNDIGQMVLTLL